MNYVFIDVETPNAKSDSICSIGLIYVENGIIVDKYYSLVNPESYFDIFNMNINKITPQMVEHSPNFLDVWKKIEKYFDNSTIVAHNAPFDISVLIKALSKYKIDFNPSEYLCTLMLSQKYISFETSEKGQYKLNKLCAALNIDFTNHHNAEADIFACYQLFNYLLENYNIDISKELHTVNLNTETSSVQRKFINYTDTTYSLRELKNISQDIINDNNVSLEEIIYLNEWLSKNESLAGNYPYDKIYSFCQTILLDGIIEESEQNDLLLLLSEFVDPINSCQCDCQIIFKNSIFCLTGNFTIGTKEDIAEKIMSLGGICKNTITKKTNYLIVGGAGNDNWKFGNYGSKVSKALEMQDKGLPILILKEDDLKDCIK